MDDILNILRKNATMPIEKIALLVNQTSDEVSAKIKNWEENGTILGYTTVINTDKLTVPHPEMHRRLFALRLLAELAPNLEHPVLHKNIETLIQEVESQGDM